MPWNLVTAPDERDRCCVVVDGTRCKQPTARRIAGSPPAWDDYTYVCADHVELVLDSQPGCVVEPMPGC
jgi:hypothetical protein